MRRVIIPLLVALVLSVGLYVPDTSTFLPESVFAQDACIPSESITAQNVGELTLLTSVRYLRGPLYFYDDQETFLSAHGRGISHWQISSLTFELIKPLLDSEYIWDASFSADGSTVAFTTRELVLDWSGSLGNFRGIRIWDLEHRSEIDYLTLDEGVTGLALSGDGGMLAYSVDDGFWLYDTASRSHIAHVSTRAALGVAFSSEQDYLVYQTIDDIYYYDISDGESILLFDDVNISSRFLITSDDRFVVGWDALPGRSWVFEPYAETTTSLLWESELSDVAIGDSDRMVTLASTTNEVQLWNLEEQSLTAIFCCTWTPITSVDFRLSESLLVSGELDGTFSFWDMNSGEVIAKHYSGEVGRITNIAFSPDMRLLLLSPSGDDQIWGIPENSEMDCSGRMVEP